MGADGTCIVCGAAWLDGAPRVAVGCVAAVPHRATDVEGRLGDDLRAEAVQEAVRGLGEALDPPGDVHASSDYRSAVAEIVVARAIAQAGAR
jgi:carbon-monoxide dehydrogenase medium subunit